MTGSMERGDPGPAHCPVLRHFGAFWRKLARFGVFGTLFWARAATERRTANSEWRGEREAGSAERLARTDDG